MKRTDRSPAASARPRLLTGIHRFAAGTETRGELDQWVLGMTLGGLVEYRLGRSETILLKNDVILIRPRVRQHWKVPHSSEGDASGPGYWHVIYAAFEASAPWSRWTDLPMDDRGYFRTNLEGGDGSSMIRKRVYQSLLKAHRLSLGASSLHHEIAYHAVGEALIWLNASVAESVAPIDPRINKAVEFIGLRLHEPIMLERIADAAMTSRSQLSLLFQERLGMSPMRYVESQRIDRARQMLRMTANPIKLIATMVGYDDPRYFIKRFKKRTGMTPRQFRDGIA